MIELLEKLARAYIATRDSGETGEARGLAHNAFMDALNEAGVEFEDREHAARIAQAIVALAEVGLWPPTLLL
jgi:hypothetical protein